MKNAIFMFVFGLVGTFLGILVATFIVSPLLEFVFGGGEAVHPLLFLFVNGLSIAGGLVGGILFSRRFQK